MQIKKHIVNIICMPIFPKERRHFVKRLLKNFDISGLGALIRFKKSKVRENSVLLVEVNGCHGEVIPGFVDYFQKMNFNVDILTSTELLKDNPFIRLDMSKVNVFASCDAFYSSMINSANYLKYKQVVLMTTDYYNFLYNNNHPATLNCLSKMKEHPSLFAIEHELSNVENYNEQYLVDCGHLITLGDFNKGIMINSHYFGNVKVAEKNTQTTFITVGAIIGKRKNHKILINAIEQLSKKGLDFKVVVVGHGKLKDLPESVHKYIELKGRLSFADMFDEMEKADFFLPLLDPENKEHDRYITTGVTGSAQLIYGFKKVPVIESKFASFYSFDNANAIVYNGNEDLSHAMEVAINSNQEEYQTKVDNLDNLAKNIYEKSFSNLKEMLND